jgi:hypothetical protein
MKQKLLIAIALGRDAKVLVMDEPAANLDPQARKIFFELLAERAEHTTMLISSHRINEVSALVNRVVELDMGKVVLDEAIANEASLAGRCTAACGLPPARAGLAKALAAVELPRHRRRRHAVGRRGRRPRPPALPGHGVALRRGGQRRLADRGSHMNRRGFLQSLALTPVAAAVLAAAAARPTTALPTACCPSSGTATPACAAAWPSATAALP